MEFTNEIFFNKPLTAGCTVIITYCGKLYREHSKDVTIVYGYGDNWEYTDSTPMKETDNGFEVTLTIKDYNTFNFCFSNSFNIWDNNSGFNYISPIGPKENDEHKEETSSTPVQEENVEEEQQEEANDSNDENVEEARTNDEDIEAVFASLLDSILDDAKVQTEKIDVNELSGFGLQSVDSIQEEDIKNDDIFAKLFDELTLDDNNNQEEIKTENAQNVEADDEPFEDGINFEQFQVQELDQLMDNLLTAVSGDYNSSEEADATPLQRVEVDGFEDVGLPAIVPEKEDWLDKILSISYNLTKKVTTACKKIGNLVKLKAQEYGFLNDKNN